MGSSNFFSGKNAVKDFLSPDKNPPLPLVEIPKQINPYYREGVRIYAKLLNVLPLGNVKSMPASNMLDMAEKSGKLNGVDRLIENSSGNTVLSLAVLGRLKGIKKTKALVSNEILEGKLDLLRVFGVEVEVNKEPICPDPSDKGSGIYKAKNVGMRKGWFNAGQYENEANPQAHERWTAKQIWNQLDGDIQMFCAGLGTTGTMVGCSKFFKSRKRKVKTIGVIRTPNNQIPGVRTRGLLNMIAFNWKDYTDCFEEIGTRESFEKSLALIRSGLVVGPSSGFALAGLLNHLKMLKEQNILDKFRNKDGKINAVFICCDSPFPYLQDYFSYLDASYFPKVKNEELLINKQEIKKKAFGEDNDLSPKKAYSFIYKENKRDLWDMIKKGLKIKIAENLMVVDVRSKAEFEHFHLAGSKNIEFRKILSNPKKYAKMMLGKTVIVVCNLGLKSSSIARLLRKEGVNSYNLQGGITEWSNLDLPRWKPDICFDKRGDSN